MATMIVASYLTSHNPYFNRWFSAIVTLDKFFTNDELVTILILIDGFLQYKDGTIMF